MIARVLTTMVVCLFVAAPPCSAEKPAKIVLISGKDSHGSGAHNWGDGVRLLARALNDESGLNVQAEHHILWPRDASTLDDAATIVILADGGGGHLILSRLAAVGKLMDKGVGIVLVHYAVEVPKEKAGNEFLKWTGGYFETHWSVNPHWTATFDKLPDHPVARGVKSFTLNDEWYYHMRFQEDMKGVVPILSALPPEETLKRGDGPHSNNPHVRAAVLERKEPQHVAWAYQRPEGGRGFSTTGAHYHKSWDNDDFRKTVLNGIIWSAGMEVPQDGVKSLPNPTKRPLARKSN
jgi:type 1 glutamine amidotransferase